MKTKNLTKYIITLSLGLVLAGAVSVIASGGPAAPSASPTTTATMYTLSDIYNRLDDFSITATVDNADISTTNTPASLHYSLSDIYGLLDGATSTLVAGNIKDGVNIFGVAGSLSNINYPANQQFTTTADTVYDTSTGLTWQRDGNNGTKTHAVALTYCNGLALDGGDWRLPSISELLTIVDFSVFNPSIVFKAEDIFTGTQSVNYWSSTSHAGNSVDARVVNFYGGGVNYGVKANSHQVRCVR